MGIKFEKVTHIYKGLNKKQFYVAIEDIDLDIKAEGEFIAVVGKTGSGKSTLIQHMNALLTQTSGKITIFDKEIKIKKNKGLNQIRKNVGLVFQFPEYQLFEETVLKDIAFGPKNFGLSNEEALNKAKETCKIVGIDESLWEKSPFNLSGGQMRRVAIAGILSMEPKILVLDEPTRGLDPEGRKEIMELFIKLHKEYNKTIVLVTHDMDIVAEYASRVIVMNDSKKVFDGTKDELFSSPDFDKFHLDRPSIQKAVMYLNEKLNKNIPITIYKMNELIDYLK